MNLDVSSWSDDTKALTAAMLTLIVVSVGGAVYGLSSGVRSVAAISAGFLALLVSSYYLTGNPFKVLRE